MKSFETSLENVSFLRFCEPLRWVPAFSIALGHIGQEHRAAQACQGSIEAYLTYTGQELPSAVAWAVSADQEVPEAQRNHESTTWNAPSFESNGEGRGMEAKRKFISLSPR